MRYTCLRSYRAKGDTVEAVPHRDADQSSAERFATLATRNSRGARVARALTLCFAQLCGSSCRLGHANQSMQRLGGALLRTSTT